MVMTRSAEQAVLRSVNRDQGWAVTVADVEQAFQAERESEGPDAAAIVVDAAGRSSTVPTCSATSGVRHRSSS